MSEQNNHITSFSIKNFKKLKVFEMDNLGQINVIGGDNNVGKTTVLESLLVSENWMDTLLQWHGTLCNRGLHIHSTDKYHLGEELNKVDNYFVLLMNFDFQNDPIIANVSLKKGTDFLLSFKNVTIDKVKDGYKNYRSSLSGAVIPFPYWINISRKFSTSSIIDELSIPLPFDRDFHKNLYSPFVNSFINNHSDLPKMYTNYVESFLGAENYLIDVLSGFGKKIKSIQPRTSFKNGDKEGNYLFITFEGELKGIPLPLFGEGFVKLFRIALEIAHQKGKRLMIDEFGVGVHHLRLKDYCKAIFKIAHENNTQLFITTHSQETLDAINDLLEEPEMLQRQQDFRYIELLEIDEKVKGFTYNFNQFHHSMITGSNIRGRKWNA